MEIERRVVRRDEALRIDIEVCDTRASESRRVGHGSLAVQHGSPIGKRDKPAAHRVERERRGRDEIGDPREHRA